MCQFPHPIAIYFAIVHGILTCSSDNKIIYINEYKCSGILRKKEHVVEQLKFKIQNTKKNRLQNCNKET